jgi:hypothetical protein
MRKVKGLVGVNLGYLSFIGSCVGARRTAGPSPPLRSARDDKGEGGDFYLVWFIGWTEKKPLIA